MCSECSARRCLSSVPRSGVRADRGGNQLVHGFVVIDVDWEGDLVDDFEGVFQGVLEGGNYYNRVDVAL